MNLPWNHPDNAATSPRPSCRNFSIPVFVGNTGSMAQGYGLEPLRGQQPRLRVPTCAMRPKDVTDGLSNTIFAGEVADHFQPWGNPINWRDPAKGINASPDGFGSPWPGGGLFPLMDGSVSFLNNAIDPAVLKC